MVALHKNLLIKLLTCDQLGKIVMPDSVEDTWLRGEVMGVGPDVESDIKEGDVVIFPPPPPHLGVYPVVGVEEWIIISENMALAKEN